MLQSFTANIKWQRSFFKEMYKMTYKNLSQNYNMIMLAVYYLVLYIIHWFFVDDSITG